ncbi:hypothetical protein [uncultured Microbulbifer sp.]|uniref:hypothetical protein n=1 Tax=uncultured Microbulbifer sp. TaxID=348147 RepID=UPI00262C7B97|nr:hypothetical protein [uncultured Microbulbifer sp.]
MTELTTHTRANKEFFARGSAPSRKQWCEWIEQGAIRGKVIDGKPYVDANHFAANDFLSPLSEAEQVTAMDLLR